MAFWVSPWPSAYSKSVTLGHLAASSLPEAVVTSRQLLPPKPSVRPRTISLVPHQGGASPPAALAGARRRVVRAAAAAARQGEAACAEDGAANLVRRLRRFIAMFPFWDLRCVPGLRM